MNILEQICDNKRAEIAKAKEILPLDELKSSVEAKKYAPKGFFNALNAKKLQKKPALIAEIKKKSPSKGIIRENFDHISIAKSYERAGADCLSILTDEKYFAGKNEYLMEVRAISPLPIIRKDFILDEYQIFEAKNMGSDCILLIVSCLSPQELLKLEGFAHDLGLDVLIEVHDKAELDIALTAKSRLIGINNRNLKTFEVKLETSINLAKHIPDDYIKVCESGINTPQDIKLMMDNGLHAFLVGESLMRQEDIEGATRKLLAL